MEWVGPENKLRLTLLRSFILKTQVGQTLIAATAAAAAPWEEATSRLVERERNDGTLMRCGARSLAFLLAVSTD